MTHSRQNFLTELLHSLEAKALPYCILRNYDNIFADETTDVDLIVEKKDVARFAEILHAAAAATGQRFVHRARYVNHSHVFWNAQSDFIRIDFETEVRWRVFPVLSAREVIPARRRQGSFYIPHPRHESTILFLQAVWRNALSDRYRSQLARLYEACADKEELRRTYVDAFGPAGGALAEFHAQIAKREFDAKLCAKLKRSILLKALTRPAALRELAGHTGDDISRLWGRLRQPAGISLLAASSAGQDQNFADLIRRLEFLFPTQKCFIQTIDLSRMESVKPGWELGLKLRRLRTLFKGGLFVRFYRVARDTDLGKIVRTHPQFVYSSRAFLCIEDSGRQACFAHVGTGFMTDSTADGPEGKKDFSALLIEFISTVLEKQFARAGRRGTFAVLIGLDGSGKTTLARNLARLASLRPRYCGALYFHWRPGIFGQREFPLPEFRETPRRAPLAKNGINSLLSALRLCKNFALAHTAYWLRIRPRLRRNQLVMVDRYFYNYLLDPDSVKYAGPRWLLAALVSRFPKPDAVVMLNASAETLLSRKQELSRAQIERQIAIMEKLDFGAARRIAVDAAEPAQAVAEKTFAALGEDAPSAQSGGAAR